MSFIQKTETELQSMNQLELAQYFKEFQESKAAALKSAMANDTEDKIASLKREMIELADKRSEAITRTLEQQGIALERIVQKSQEPKKERTTLLGDVKGELLKLKNQEQQWVTKSITITDNFSDYTGGFIDTDVTLIPGATPFIQSILSARTMPASNAVIYYEQAERTGGAGVTAEGAVKSNNEYELTEVRLPAKKITSLTKVSQELIDDLPFMESVIREDSLMEVLRKADEQILNGTGLGANLKGIFTSATTFFPGAFAGTIPSSNNYDVLTVAMAQVANNHFRATHILMNPADVAGMKLSKTSTGEYAIPAFVASDGRSVSGVTVIENSGVTAGTYLVMDSTKAEVYTRQGIEFKIGYDGDDFSRNMVTIIAEWRGLVVVKSNNSGAFVKGTFATDKAALEVSIP